ncbi:MFS transporter [Streptomyces sp. NPDC005534]|uniref:MFS transporter n=1 Tax=Streptomyces sp. NPDC005534 TaxID=3155714 RepID=UPI00345147F5
MGPFLGGWLFTLDPILPFAADALSYGVSAVLLLRIASRPARQVAGAERDNRLTAGLRWLTHQRALLAALLFAAGINVVSAAAQTTMVVSLRQSGAGGTAIGAVMGCAGVGAMLGAASAPWLIKRIPAARLFLLIGAVWAAGLAVFSATTQPWTIGPVLVVVVFFSPPAGIVVGRAMLVLAPRDLLGRVSTATGLLMAGLASLGPLLAGSFVDSLGSSHTWLALAGTAAVVTVLSSVPLLRETSLDAVAADTKSAGPAGPAPVLQDSPAPADGATPAEPSAQAAPAAPAASAAPAGPTTAAVVRDSAGPLGASRADRAEVMAHGDPDGTDDPGVTPLSGNVLGSGPGLASGPGPAPTDPATPPPARRPGAGAA